MLAPSVVSRLISSIRLALSAEPLCLHPMRPAFRVPLARLVPLEHLRLLAPLLPQAVLRLLVPLLNKGICVRGCVLLPKGRRMPSHAGFA